MLPASYGFPAAVILIVGGAVACFAGYRFFRVVLAIYGFILGALMASSMMGVGNNVGMIVAALVGGLIGAVVLVLAYFVGIALVGAGLGALIAHEVWHWIKPGDPPALIVIGAALVGAALAMVVQRYVIVVGTAFGGAWTMIVGGLALSGAHVSVDAAARNNVWLAYPMNPAPGQYWVLLVWIGLGVAGVFVQLAVTAKGKK